MSTWIEVKPEDITVDLENESVDILYNTDNNGNNYITVPLEALQLAVDIAVISSVTNGLKGAK